MSEPLAALRVPAANDAAATWSRAYVRFLLSKEESLALKAAPLALIGVLPLDIVSNLIPGIGLLDDAGYLLIVVVVLFRTLSRVNRYRIQP